MERNEGTVDRIIRAVLAVIFLVVGLGPLRGLQGAVLGIIVAVVGLILAFTAATGFCLIYKLLGVSTTGTCVDKEVDKGTRIQGNKATRGKYGMEYPVGDIAARHEPGAGRLPLLHAGRRTSV
jgi:hypothetical protein